jgi:DNA polymerase III gamma/tau subunit
MKILVSNARGSYRDALSLLDVVFSGSSGKDKKITEKEVRLLLGLPDIEMVDMFLTSLVDNDPQQALELIENIEDKGINFQQFASYTLEVLREVLVAKIKGNDLDYKFFDKVSQKDILALVKAFLDIERSLKGSTNQSLVMEMIIPEFCTGTGNEEEEEEEEEEDTTDEYLDKDIDIKDIRKQWNKVADAIKPIHKHLYAFLGTSKPTKFEKGKLYIEVPFQFYKDQIDCPESREVINRILEKVFSIKCSFICTVNEKAKPRMKSNIDVVLKKVPNKTKKTQQGSFNQGGISPDVEAIFEGM